MTFAKPALAALSLFACTLLVGCGNDQTIATAPPTPATTGTGNWLISGFLSEQPGGGILAYSFGGSLLNTGGQITGVFHINQSCFGSGATDVPYTGTLDDKNNLHITSAPVNGQVLTFQGTLSSDGSSIADGNFNINGGCTGSVASITMPSGPGAEIETTAVRVPGLNGSWAPGTALSNPGLSEQLTQSATPDAHGDYALTGTVAIQGLACSTNGTLQPGSFVSGDLGHEIVLLSDGSTLNAALQLSYNPVVETKPSFTLYPGTITGGQCDGPVDVNLQ